MKSAVKYMSKYVFLSHMLKNDTPCYNGDKNVHISSASSIINGDSTNSMSIKITNHVGTHIDFPCHFHANGKTLNDYAPGFFIFDDVAVWDIPLSSGTCIEDEVINYEYCECNVDLLIIRTGYSSYYKQDKYWNDNPGLTLAAAKHIKAAYPKLKALGADIISVNAYKNKSEGRLAHMELLSQPEIIIIEDMYLENINGKIKKVIAAPMLVKNADGVPCTVIAEVE